MRFGLKTEMEDILAEAELTQNIQMKSPSNIFKKMKKK